MVNSPYRDRPKRSFWRSGVAETSSPVPAELYKPKFAIQKSDRIATAGSCFAQHLGRNLLSRGYTVVDMEPAPAVLDSVTAQSFGYGIYSARYGNIYTVRQLLQLVQECMGRFTPADRVWERDGRFFDAQRPSVEPEGLGSPELVLEHRAYHLQQVRQMFESVDVLVFTLGLTEVWETADASTVFPTAPGTIAGDYDPDRYRFRNLTFLEISSDFRKLLKLLRSINPKLKLLLTVSPVPLTATATDNHVLVATTYSKSVLRSVAGQLADQVDFIDYFPSYEIITGAPARYRFFEDNMREVTAEGVANVMTTFFSSRASAEDQASAPPMQRLQASPPKRPREKAPGRKEKKAETVVCEDVLLEAFAE
jgi:hypothetical protein